MNRRLIRPSLMEVKVRGSNDRSRKGSKQVPEDATSAEAYYHTKQMQARTPMVIVLTDNETLHGSIEWYDHNCIKVHRSTGPNLLVYKTAIKYIYKDESADADDTKGHGDAVRDAVPDDEEIEVAHARQSR